MIDPTTTAMLEFSKLFPKGTVRFHNASSDREIGEPLLLAVTLRTPIIDGAKILSKTYTFSLRTIRTDPSNWVSATIQQMTADLHVVEQQYIHQKK